MHKRLLLPTLLLLSWQAHAVESLTFATQQASGAGWSAQQVTLTVRLPANPPSDGASAPLDATIVLQGLRQSALPAPVNQVSIHCADLHWLMDKITCAHGDVQVGADWLPPIQASVTFTYPLGDAPLAVELINPGLGNGLRVLFRSAANEWVAELDAKAVDLQTLATAIQLWAKLPTDTQIKGKGDLKIRFSGTSGPTQGMITGALRDFIYANVAGTQAAQGVRGDVELRLRERNGQWQTEGELGLAAGELYSAPFYYAHSGAPVAFTWKAAVIPKRKAIHASTVRYHHPGVVDLAGDFSVQWDQPEPLRSFSLHLPSTPVEGLYRHYLHNWFTSMEYGELTASGALALNIAATESGKRVRADIENLSIVDARNRFAIKRANGHVDWDSSANADALAPTWLNWDTAQIRRIPFTVDKPLTLRLYADNAELIQPLRISVLDGSLDVLDFSLRHGADSTRREMDFSLSIQPISMESVTTALDLPKLGGQISGMVPSVQLRGRKLDVGGALLFKLFDGDITIHQLGMDDPLGAMPIVSAQVDVQHLNLATLTQYFSFGYISGEVDGYLRDLRMIQWRPVAFRGYFGTPDAYAGTKVISQKAIENISKIGGSSVVNAISGGILQFFENFSYDKIGWRCVLANGVCRMSGAEAADNGYYLVKGWGLPRIDVMGYNQEVDWDTLLSRIQAAVHAGAPVVK